MQVAQRGFDRIGQLDGIRAGLLDHRQDDRGVAHIAGIADPRHRREADVGDLPKLYRQAVAQRHDDIT